MVAVIALVVAVAEVLVWVAAINCMVVVVEVLGVDVLADASANTFAVVMTDLDFPV